jgi:hypothetical protein
MNINVVQCDATSLRPVLVGLHDAWSWEPMHVVIERFVIGPRSARSQHQSTGILTRDQIEEAKAWTTILEQGTLSLQSTAEVKPWATDVRLAAAGLLMNTTGMRHARDAARHALFAACKHFQLPDPLSKRGNHGQA